MPSAVTDPLFDPAVVEQPHAYYAHLRESDPVHRIEGTDAYLVARLDLIHEVVGNPNLFSSQSSEFLCVNESNEPGLRSPGSAAPPDIAIPNVLATADPPDHGRQRRILNKLLSTGTISTREDEFRRLIDDALDQPLEEGRVEWMSEIAEPLPMVMVARLLGLPDSSAPFLKAQGYASVEQISGFVSEERRSELLGHMAEMGPVVDSYLTARSSEDPDQSTVIGACARASAGGALGDMESLAILGLLLAAGGESTTSLLGTGVRILAQQPDLQDRLRAAPNLIPAFVEEACRIDPPFRGHYRRVVSDTTLAGVRLPAGSRLVLLWPAANRDPRVFDRPDEVDISRSSPRRHVGFGWGIHLCIGAPLARLEAQVTFERLLARTSSVFIEGAPEALRYHKSLMIRRLVQLPLTLCS